MLRDGIYHKLVK